MEKSKEELLNIIEQQEEILKRYKDRLKDLVCAHKRLIAEQESWKKCFKAVTGDASGQNIKQHGVEDEATVQEYGSRNQQDVQSKINTLSQTLLALSAEKSAIESEYQADRKRLITQMDQQEETIKNLEEQLERERKLTELTVERTKSEMKLSEHKGEVEHMGVIKELREMLTKERVQREKKESEVSKLKLQLEELNAQLRMVEEVSQRNKIDGNSEECTLNRLKQELKDVREEYNTALMRERSRVQETEGKLRILMSLHEERVSKLEEQLSALSSLVSKYDKARQTDQESIRTLKDRLLHLEMENVNSTAEDDQQLTKEQMMDRVTHLKQQLLLQSKSADELRELKDILMRDLKDDASQSQCSCHEKFFKQDAECQVSSELVVPSKHLTPYDSSVGCLETKTANVAIFSGKPEEYYAQKLKEYERVLEKERSIRKEKLSDVEANFQNKLIALEQELSKQRTRTLSIIEEKDKIIEDFKNQLSHRWCCPAASKGSVVEQRDELVDILGLPATSAAVSIHYVQDAAHKEAEISRLRQENYELQSKLYEQQKNKYYDDETHQQHVTKLKESLLRLERTNSLKEEVNTEYLKNVVLKYLLSADCGTKTHMLNAIATVLRFSDAEITQVKRKHRIKVKS